MPPRWPAPRDFLSSDLSRNPYDGPGQAADTTPILVGPARKCSARPPPTPHEAAAEAARRARITPPEWSCRGNRDDSGDSPVLRLDGHAPGPTGAAITLLLPARAIGASPVIHLRAVGGNGSRVGHRVRPRHRRGERSRRHWRAEAIPTSEERTGGRTRTGTNLRPGTLPWRIRRRRYVCHDAGGQERRGLGPMATTR